MATTDHRDILLVAGEDPYAFKRIVDVMRPHIRPDGEGGCIRPTGGGAGSPPPPKTTVRPSVDLE
jgi:hypothetical protein